MTPWAALAIFAAGLAAGTINVIVGSGSLITFPTLLALGYPPVLANVSNNVGLVPGSVSAVHAYRRDIGACGIDWDITEGLPVATPGRIIADLARDDLDGSHQGTVIADVLEQGLLPLPEVGARLEPFAGQWSEPDGNALACRFLAAAGRAFPR